MQRHWVDVTLSHEITIRSPVALTRADTTPIDSDVSVFTDTDVTVVVDAGPFADPLTQRPGAELVGDEIGGRPARVVVYHGGAEVGDVAAAHFPASGLTLTVTGS